MKLYWPSRRSMKLYWPSRRSLKLYWPSRRSMKLYWPSRRSFVAVRMGACRAATCTKSTDSRSSCIYECSSSTHVFRLVGVDSTCFNALGRSDACRGSNCERILSIAIKALLWMDPCT